MVYGPAYEEVLHACPDGIQRNAFAIDGIVFAFAKASMVRDPVTIQKHAARDMLVRTHSAVASSCNLFFNL